MKKFRLPITIVLTLMVLFSCEDPWEKHLDEFSLDSASENLLELMQGTSELSNFYQLISDAGAEQLFAETKMKTVWAPSNSALDNLPAEITGDSEKLLQFIKNHAASGLYPQSTSQEGIRLKMLNGKRIPINMSEMTIYDIPIEGEFNKAATNGILHIVNDVIDLKSNIWEFIESAEPGNMQMDYLNSLSGEVFVDSLATIIDYDSETSAPIYDTASGIIWYNEFLFENSDLRNEDSLYTMFILENDIYNTLYNRFSPYYAVNTDALVVKFDTSRLWNYMVNIDLVFSGYWKAEDILGSLTSVNGIEVPFDQGAILETIETSNGIIYRMSNCDIPLEDKFPPIIIEAETLNKVVYGGGGKTGFTRVKPLASGGYDFVLDDHDGSPGRIIYPVGMVASTKYDFYWLAVDDFDGTIGGAAPDSLIRQKIDRVQYSPNNPIENQYIFFNAISDSLLYVEDLSYETAQERYAGTYTFKYYDEFWLQLIGSGANTTLTLDYLKIVPVFE